LPAGLIHVQIFAIFVKPQALSDPPPLIHRGRILLLEAPGKIVVKCNDPPRPDNGCVAKSLVAARTKPALVSIHGDPEGPALACPSSMT